MKHLGPHSGNKTAKPVPGALFKWLGVLVLAWCWGCRDAPPPVQPGVDVQHYRLHLRLDPATWHLNGHAHIRLTRPDSLDTIRLHLADLTVDSMWVDGQLVRFQHAGVHLYLPLCTQATSTEIDIWYHGIPARGLHTETVYGEPVVFTDTWPEDTRGWMPAVDHPSDPAAFSFTLEVPVGYEAVANGRLQAQDTLGASVRTMWHLEAPAPTYAFAFAVSDFEVRHTTLADTLPIQYYLLPPDVHQARRLHRVPGALAYFSALTAPYPYTNFAIVQVPIHNAGMENAALPFLNTDLFRTGADLEQVAVHEAAHQWFGNRVVLQDWRDLWLSEGMATYLTLLFYGEMDGVEAIRQRKVDLVRQAFQVNATGTTLVADAAPDPGARLTWVPYLKGAAVLHLLHLKMGDAAFFEALRALYDRFSGRPMSTEAAQAVFEETSGLDLDALFAYWVYGWGVPTLDVQWVAETRTLQWTVRGDAGTLDAVPFELCLNQGGRTRYVLAEDGQAAFADWGPGRPRVQPVGVLLEVEQK